MLFFGAFTGASVVRHDPPTATYSTIVRATPRENRRRRALPGENPPDTPRQIAVFAQSDPSAMRGSRGVAKAFRVLGLGDNAVLRLNYQRNTIDVDDAVNQLKAQRVPIKAVVMAATYRAAAKFVEKTRDFFPGMIYTNVSAVGATTLAEELTLLDHATPTASSSPRSCRPFPVISSIVLEYKNALAKIFPGRGPGLQLAGGYFRQTSLIQALKRAGPQFDTEKLVDILENTSNLDLGLGTALNFGPRRTPGFAQGMGHGA